MSINPVTYSRPTQSHKAARSQNSTPDFAAELDKARKGKPISNSERMDQYFNQIVPNAPASVKEAWDKTVAEVGADWLFASDGRMLKLPSLMAENIQNSSQGDLSGTFGDSVESAINAMHNAIENLDRPDRTWHATDHKEKEFYNLFLGMLEGK